MLRSDWLGYYEAICYSPLVAKSTSKTTAEFKRNGIVKVVSFFLFSKIFINIDRAKGGGGRRSCANLGLRETACEVSRELHVPTLLARIVGLLLRENSTKHAVAFMKQYLAVARSFSSFNTVIKICLLFSRVSESTGTIKR